MQISRLGNQRYQIRGQTEPPASKKIGIAGYNRFVGWILKVFGYAIALKDDNNTTFYLNRKSAIHWLQRHGSPNLKESTKGREVIKLINKAVAKVLPVQTPPLQPKAFTEDKQEPEPVPASLPEEPIPEAKPDLTSLKSQLQLPCQKSLFRKRCKNLVLQIHCQLLSRGHLNLNLFQKSW